MTATPSFTVWCDIDECVDWFEGGQDRSKTAARTSASYRGWTFKKGKDRCPSHSPDGKVSREPLRPGETLVDVRDLLNSV